MSRGRWRGWLTLGLLVLLAPALRAEPAPLRVTGLGWWQDRQARFSLERLLGEDRGATLNANAVEDAVFLLLASLAENGYQRPVIIARPTLADGRRPEFRFDHRLETWLPRPMAVEALELKVERGVRFRVREIVVHGTDGAIGEQEVRWAFGLDPEAWLGTRYPAYHRGAVSSAASRVEEEMRARGYAEARVEVTLTRFDEATGEVELRVEVRPGPRWRITALREPAQWSDGVVPPTYATGSPWWTPAWRQDLTQMLRRAHHRAGYPDVAVELGVIRGARDAEGKAVEIEVRIEPGPRTRVGAVDFTGATRTHRPTLERRVLVAPGDWYDPGEIDAARRRLMRLGLFRRVDAPLTDVGRAERDLVFALTERAPWEASLLLGYGSYEQARGGFDLERHNLWGRAHRARLQGVHSMKGTRAESLYTVPELFGDQVEGSLRAFGLWREEVAFEREEFGGAVTLRRPLPWLGAEGRVSYTYQALRNRGNVLATREEDATRNIAAGIEVGLARDRRDNPLRPRRGYRWYAQVEAASVALGGEVDYQRAEFGGSYHTAWGRGRWIHVGLAHGAVLTLGADDDRELPVNRRYYPGGESSIRGYREGRAAPRNEAGAFIGAKTYTLLNVEGEQALTRTWSGVLFWDTLWQADRLSDYPAAEALHSAGLGLRYQTIIGPVRVEYGHNLNRRPGDARGSWHLSVGFPF